MKKNLKRIVSIVLITIYFITFLNTGMSFAANTNTKNKLEEMKNAKYSTSMNNKKDEKEDESKYTEEYKKYLKLSEEEKKKVAVIPRKYKVPLDSIYEDTVEVKESPSLFNLFGAFAKTKLVSSYADELPEKFDLRDRIKIAYQNQGNYGLCWDFASMKTLETNLSLHGYGDYNFSELHVDYIMSEEFGNGMRKLHEGGWFRSFEEYVSEGYGPVLESEVPYDAEYTIDDYDYLLSLKPKAYVKETIDFPTISKDYEEYTDEQLDLFRAKVKKHLMENGGIYVSIAPPDLNVEYFNTETASEYYKGDGSQLLPDRNFHAVTVIGWDDNYSRNNFNNNQRPSKDGAYICLNSWHNDEEDEDGHVDIFYVSYEDVEIERQMSGTVSATTDLEEVEKKVIKFEDVNLYNAIKEILDRKILDYNDDILTIEVSKNALNNIEYIDLSNKDISNISGIEKFTNLSELSLTNNKISDIRCLSDLENLVVLNLSKNNITDISSFENLEKLSSLDLQDNKIEEISISNNCNMRNLSILNLSNNKICSISGIEKLTELFSLNLDNNKLTDIPNISNLTNLLNISLGNNLIENINSIVNVPSSLYYINLSNNNIEDISKIKDIEIQAIDLSDNQIIEGLDKISNISTLEMNNCGLDNDDIQTISTFDNLTYLSIKNNEEVTDLAPLRNEKLDYLDLSENHNINFLTINNFLNSKEVTNSEDDENHIISLILKNCGITDVSFLNNKLVKYSTLDLSDNNIENCNSLKDTIIYNISLENNNIKNISGLNKTKVINLNNNQNCENINGFDKLEEIEDFNMNNCNLESLDFLEEINDNKNLYIYVSNNNISDISALKEINNIQYIDLSSNNISDLDTLKNWITEYSEVPHLNIGKNKLNFDEDSWNIIKEKTGFVCEQNVDLDYEIQINKDNYFELPFMIKKSYANRYKDEIEIIPNNCRIDYKQNKLILKTSMQGTEKASVEIKGGEFDGTKFNITYNGVSSVSIESMNYETEPSRLEYIEGENFDTSNIKLRVIYANGSYDIVTDFEVENGQNLKKGQDRVIIKYGGHSITQNIVVYGEDEVTTVKVKDKNLLKALKQSVKNIKVDEEKLEIVVLKETIENTSTIGKGEGLVKSNIESIEGLSAFYNLDNINISENYKLKDIKELAKMEKLDSINLTGTAVEDISCLEDLPNIKLIELHRSSIKNIGNILNNNSLVNLSIKGSFFAEDFEIKENKVILPQAIQAIKQKYPNCKMDAEIYYEVDEEGYEIGEPQKINVKSDGDKVYIELDTEINEQKPDQTRMIILNITNAEKISNCNYRIMYTPSTIKNTTYEFVSIDDKKYITNIDINENDYEDVVNYENFPGAKYTLRAYDKAGNELKAGDKIPTGSMIQMITRDEENNRDIVWYEYYVALKGDIDCNGEIDIYDILALVELVFDKDSNYTWDECIKLAGNCTEDSNTETPNLYDILRLIEYQFDGKKW